MLHDRLNLNPLDRSQLQQLAGASWWWVARASLVATSWRSYGNWATVWCHGWKQHVDPGCGEVWYDLMGFNWSKDDFLKDKAGKSWRESIESWHLNKLHYQCAGWSNLEVAAVAVLLPVVVEVCHRSIDPVGALPRRWYATGAGPTVANQNHSCIRMLQGVLI